MGEYEKVVIGGVVHTMVEVALDDGIHEYPQKPAHVVLDHAALLRSGIEWESLSDGDLIEMADDPGESRVLWRGNVFLASLRKGDRVMAIGQAYSATDLGERVVYLDTVQPCPLECIFLGWSHLQKGRVYEQDGERVEVAVLAPVGDGVRYRQAFRATPEQLQEVQ